VAVACGVLCGASAEGQRGQLCQATSPAEERLSNGSFSGSMAGRKEHCSERAGGMHPLLVFHCNFPTQGNEPCNRPLDEAWVTSCSHLLCYSHAKEWFQSHDGCPLCRSGRVNILRVNLTQASVAKRGRAALLGMTPPQIMQSTQTALAFWVDQTLHEFMDMGQRQRQLTDQQRNMEDHIKSKLTEGEALCNAMEAEQQQLEAKIGEVEKETRQVKEEMERLWHEVAAAQERCSRLQTQASCERQQEFIRGPLLEGRSPSPASAFTAVTGRRMNNSFTPGFLGTGRATRRRIQNF